MSEKLNILILSSAKWTSIELFAFVIRFYRNTAFKCTSYSMQHEENLYEKKRKLGRDKRGILELYLLVTQKNIWWIRTNESQ